MKKFVKTLAPLALTGMLALTTACVQQPEPIATGPAEYVPIASLPGTVEPIFDDGDEYAFDLPNFMQFRGKAVEVTSYEDTYFVLLECPETNDQTRFLVDVQSALLIDGELAEGMDLVGWFDSTMPAPMIWPPQHRAVVLMEESPYNVFLTRFYENDGVLVSGDGIHSLDITDETGIILADGNPFEGELDGRKLLVEFYEEGRVLSPARITVLFEVAVHPIHYFSDEELAEIGEIGISSGPALLSPEDIEAMWSSMFDPETVQIIVKDEVLDAPKPFTCSTAGTIFLPVVAIAEALGYTVTDDGSEVIIAPGSIVTEGVNSYFRGREAARELTAAPVRHDGALFVPWEFFHEILSGAAYVVDGNVHVVLQE